MGEGTKKGIGKLKIGFVISAIVIVVLAGFSIYYVAAHSHTDTEYGALQSAYDNYVATHHHTDSEYDALKSERDALRAPKLIPLNLQLEDVHSVTWHLHIWGTIVNVGTDTAYNCKIHVITYQGGVELHNTYIKLGTGTIAGESWTWVDENLYYTGGGPLTGWTYALEWTTTP